MNYKAIPDFSHEKSEMTYSTETSEEPAVNTDAREKPVMKDRYGYDKLIPPQATPREYTILWNNVILFTYFHLAAFYAIYLCFTGSVKLVSVFFYILIYMLSAIGITAGAHRLWTHKAYKAKLPLEIILMLLNSMAFENTALHWCRDHRMHHKYSDTDADPHNATRGFFYSHIGWLLVKKHKEVSRRAHTIDMTDLLNNPILQFQKKYAIPVIGTTCFFLPTVIPMYFWGETLISAWHMNMLRYIGAMHFAFCVNSIVHIWGYKPYDVNISPTENPTIALFSGGEGFHNFHHVFPWDYRTSEFGKYLNFTTMFINFFAKIGWAYDLKTVPTEVIETRKARSGDGSFWNVSKNMKTEN